MTKSAQLRSMGTDAVAELGGADMLEILLAEASADFSNAILRSELSLQNKVPAAAAHGASDRMIPFSFNVA